MADHTMKICFSLFAVVKYRKNRYEDVKMRVLVIPDCHLKP